MWPWAALTAATAAAGLSWLQLTCLLATLVVAATGALVLAAPQLAVGARAKKLIGYDDRCLPTGLEALIAVCRVPKSYFTHFYITGMVSAAATLWFAAGLYVWPSMSADQRHKTFRQNIDPLVAAEHKRWAAVDPPAALLVIALLLVHCLRRCYESVRVQVFSPYSDMTLAHYAMGHWHYLTLGLCALADAAGLMDGPDRKAVFDGSISWFLSERPLARLVGTVLFLWLSWQQAACLRRLAALRRAPASGTVYTYAHGIVAGGWFDLVSCPHFLFEVGIYLSLHLILGWRAPTWTAVTGFVAVNQLVAALITHSWYRRHFGHLYPDNRRAILPHLL